MEKEKKKFQRGQISFGERIRRIRLALGLNQAEFARVLGFSANTIISRFEKNKRIPTLETLVRLAQIQHPRIIIDLHELIMGMPSGKPESWKEEKRNLLWRLSRYNSREMERLIHDRYVFSGKLAEAENQVSEGDTKKAKDVEWLKADLSRTEALIADLAEEQNTIQRELDCLYLSSKDPTPKEERPPEKSSKK